MFDHKLTRVPLISEDIFEALVNVADRVAVKMDIMTIPMMIHTIANKRPAMERTVLSPYL